VQFFLGPWFYFWHDRHPQNPSFTLTVGEGESGILLMGKYGGTNVRHAAPVGAEEEQLTTTRRKDSAAGRRVSDGGHTRYSGNYIILRRQKKESRE